LGKFQKKPKNPIYLAISSRKGAKDTKGGEELGVRGEEFKRKSPIPHSSLFIPLASVAALRLGVKSLRVSAIKRGFLKEIRFTLAFPGGFG